MWWILGGWITGSALLTVAFARWFKIQRELDARDAGVEQTIQTPEAYGDLVLPEMWRHHEVLTLLPGDGWFGVRGLDC